MGARQAPPRRLEHGIPAPAGIRRRWLHRCASTSTRGRQLGASEHEFVDLVSDNESAVSDVVAGAERLVAARGVRGGARVGRRGPRGGGSGRVASGGLRVEATAEAMAAGVAEALAVAAAAMMNSCKIAQRMRDAVAVVRRRERATRTNRPDQCPKAMALPPPKCRPCHSQERHRGPGRGFRRIATNMTGLTRVMWR